MAEYAVDFEPDEIGLAEGKDRRGLRVVDLPARYQSHYMRLLKSHLFQDHRLNTTQLDRVPDALDLEAIHIKLHRKTGWPHTHSPMTYPEDLGTERFDTVAAANKSLKKTAEARREQEE